MPLPLSRSHTEAFRTRQSPNNSQMPFNISPSPGVSSKYNPPSGNNINNQEPADVSPRTLPISFRSFSFDEKKPVSENSTGSLSNPVLTIRKSSSANGLSYPSSSSSVSQDSVVSDISSSHSPRSPHHSRRPTSHGHGFSGSDSISPSAIPPDGMQIAHSNNSRSSEGMFTHDHLYQTDSSQSSPPSTSFNKEYRLQPIPHFNTGDYDSVTCLEGSPGLFEHRSSCDANRCHHHHHRESSNSIVSIACSDDGLPQSPDFIDCEISAKIALQPMTPTMLVPLIDRSEEMRDLLAHPANKRWAKMAENSIGSDKYYSRCIPLWTQTSRGNLPDVAWLQRSRELLTTTCGGGFLDARLWNEFCGMVGWDEDEELLDSHNHHPRSWHRRNSSGSMVSDSSGAMSSIMEEEADNVEFDRRDVPALVL
ncbi:hypothetical protein EDC01DRAFT_648384 [Geopyxis carbonaria]|nr:hypothetical protein EDC01DRAFT_648384 [Geopyxis carbonaria]